MSKKTLAVDEKTVRDFLRESKSNPFFIPDYQRAYSWDRDDAELLFDDLKEFTDHVIAHKDKSNYFLGTIVSYINADDAREIIDGQQRIVSLLMLLRAIYTKLSLQSPQTQKTQNLMMEIGSTIWDETDEILHTVDHSTSFIRSECIDDTDKETLQSILKTGECDAKNTDLYSKNYRLFQNKYDALYAKDVDRAEKFVRYLLDRTIIFPIEANTQDMALTIFATLNNRGKPLSDSDILRAKIYSFLDTDARKTFNEDWKYFSNRTKEVGESKKDVFTHYMYYLRAREKDCDATTIGVRKYFTQNDSARLNDKDILKVLNRIADLWSVVNNQEVLDGEPWSKDTDILKIVDMLKNFQNESWKGAVVVYYLEHGNKPDFKMKFLKFLRKLFSQYVPLYILNPDRTFLRTLILKLDIAIIESDHPKFAFQTSEGNRLDDPENINRLIKKMGGRNNGIITRILMKSAAYTYDNQKLLPTKFDVEHIMPKQWSAAYTAQGYTEEKFNEYVDRLGNLTPLEAKLNKKSSNAPFEKKKKFYKESKILMTRALVNEPNDWTPDAIAIRSNKIAESLIKLWKKWSDDYDQ